MSEARLGSPEARVRAELARLTWATQEDILRRLLSELIVNKQRAAHARDVGSKSPDGGEGE